MDLEIDKEASNHLSERCLRTDVIGVFVALATEFLNSNVLGSVSRSAGRVAAIESRLGRRASLIFL